MVNSDLYPVLHVKYINIVIKNAYLWWLTLLVLILVVSYYSNSLTNSDQLCGFIVMYIQIIVVEITELYEYKLSFIGFRYALKTLKPVNMVI